MFLVFDVETTGLPTKQYGKYPDPRVPEYYKNARMIEISWMIFEATGKNIDTKSTLISYNGPITNTHIHHITSEMLSESGRSIDTIVDVFKKHLSMVEIIVAHNIKFDVNILLSELYRIKRPDICDLINSKRKKDTMLMGCNYLGQQKWIKLIDLYTILCPNNKKKLFTDENPGHRALTDVKACAICYMRLKQ